MEKLKRDVLFDYCALCKHGENDIHLCEHLGCNHDTDKYKWNPANESCLNCQYQVNDGDPEGWIDGLWGIEAEKFLCVIRRKKGAFGSPIKSSDWCSKWQLHLRFRRPNNPIN